MSIVTRFYFWQPFDCTAELPGFVFAACLSHRVDFYLDFYPFSCTPLITHTLAESDTSTRTNFHASFLGRDGIVLAVSHWLHFTLLHIESNYIVINYHINLYLAQKSVAHRAMGGRTKRNE